MAAQNGLKLSQESTTVGVLGGGAWGTALAFHCARRGHNTLLWARETEVVEGINGPDRENSMFLKGYKAPEGLKASSDMTAVIKHAELLLMVIPTPFVASTIKGIRDQLRPEQILVSCTKGILNETLETPHEILSRILSPATCKNLAYLSGPSFAAEVAEGQPTVVTIASHNEQAAAKVQMLLSNARFRCYRTNDVEGVELGGALKNVLAIACGISDGLGFGNNARAALITRGLVEITRLAVASGAHPMTMGGLAGMGDLVLTCTGDASRNRTVGLRLGKGEKLEDIIKSTNAVAEGVLTSKSAANLAKKLNVDCPIIDGIFKVIHQNAEPMAMVSEVMSRDLRVEVDQELLEAAKL